MFYYSLQEALRVAALRHAQPPILMKVLGIGRKFKLTQDDIKKNLVSSPF